MAFKLDERLEKDSFIIGSNAHNLLLMMNDSRYPWFIVVPKIEGVSEWFDLTETQQVQLHRDSVLLGQCVQSAFAGDKINIASLGNIVRQLHVHVVGRNQQDPAWPGPVWGHSAAVHYTADEKQHRITQLFVQDQLPFSSA